MSTAQQQYVEKQGEVNQAQDTLRQSFSDMEEVKADYLRELTDSPLNEGTTDVLENMLSQDWVLANFKHEEVTEVKWLLRLLKRKVKAMHPPADSTVTGRFRAYVCDDKEEQLQPLTQHQELYLDQFFNGVFSRVSRAREGWQQDKMNESIARSEVNNGNGDSSTVWDRLSFS